MSAKDTTVNIRVDAATKARWQEAAGGPRKLSAWLSELANAASSPDAAEALVAIGAQIKIAQAAVPMAGVQVIGASDRAHRYSRPLPATQGPGDESSSAKRDGAGAAKAAPLPTIVEQEASSGQCPRWMHHRKGVYCGTCKKVN